MHSYEDRTKEELIQEIRSLKMTNREILETLQETERLEFSWTGNLGQWFWNFPLNEVSFNPMKAGALGYQKEELPETVPFQFFTDKLHPEDYDYVMDQMRAHLAGEVPVWEVRYRIQAKDGSWKVYQDRGKVTKRDEEGRPLFLKGIVFDVTEEEREREELLQQNSSLQSKLKIDSLTSLYTRKAMMVELGKSVNRAKNPEQTLSLVLMRVDHYTKYEEEYGLLLNEAILKELGRVIKKVVGEDHPAGRFRETVFMLLLEDTSLEEAYQMAETIRQEVLHTFFPIMQKITLSAGVASCEPGDTVSKLLDKTTEKLLQAQQQGGNQTVGKD